MYKGREARPQEVKPSQVGFYYSALLRVLQTAQYPERKEWRRRFEAIGSDLDGALFMTEALLKARYEIDFIRIKMESDRKTRHSRRARKTTQ